MLIIQKFLKRQHLRGELERQASAEIRPATVQQGSIRRRSDPARKTSSTSYLNSKNAGFLNNMSEKEQRALRVTWKHLKGTAGLRKVTALMQRVFDKLISQQPAVNRVFFNAAFLKRTGQALTVCDHAKLLAVYIDDIISQGRNDGEGAEKIGQAHICLTKAGMTPRMWESFGETFSEVMGLLDCVRAYPYAPRAWNLLIAALTDQFRAAYEGKSKHKVSGSSISSEHPKLRVLVEQISVTSMKCKRVDLSNMANRKQSYGVNEPRCSSARTSPSRRQTLDVPYSRTVSVSAQSVAEISPHALKRAPLLRSNLSLEA